MKKNLLKLLMLSIAMIALFGCKKGGDTPEAVATSFFNAINQENWDAAKELSTESTKVLIDYLAQMMPLAKMSGTVTEKGPGKIENVKCIEDGDICNCTLEIDGTTQNLKLVKVEGKWLVDQSKEDFGFGN